MNSLIKVLQSYLFDSTTEDSFQRGIAMALTDSKVEFEREVKLSRKDRIDFIVSGGVGVEVKIDGTTTQVMRQAQRYLKSDLLTCLVIATTCSKHMELPSELGGKQLLVYWQNGLL